MAAFTSVPFEIHSASSFQQRPQRFDIQAESSSEYSCFGWSTVRNKPTLVIAGAEIDSLTLCSLSDQFDVVTMPKRGFEWIVYDKPMLDKYDDIVLWLDYGEKTDPITRRIASGLGIERVRIIDPNTVRHMGANSIYDLHLNGNDENITTLIETARYQTRMVPACSGMSLEELADEALVGKTALDIMGNIRIFPQEMTLLAGYNGTGKTTLAYQMAHHAAANGIKPFIMSPEMPPKRTGSILARQTVTTPEPSRQTWGQVYSYVRQNFTLSIAEERLTPDAVMMDFEKAYRLGCRFFILDSLTCVRLKELDAQADFADQLRNWARTHSNVFLLVLAHMRKPAVGVNARVTRYDIRGAGEITDLASAVYLIDRKDPFNPKHAEIYRDFDAMVLKDKCRETGNLTRTWLHFSPRIKLFHHTMKPWDYLTLSQMDQWITEKETKQ